MAIELYRQNYTFFLCQIPRPDEKPDFLGLKVLDEPSLEQSDPTVLNLQLKALSKQASTIPVAVSHIEDAESSKGRVNKWIKSIEELHDTKPKTEVRYKTKMPEFDKLMEVRETTEGHPGKRE